MDRIPPNPDLIKIAVNASEAIVILSKAAAELVKLVGAPVIVEEAKDLNDPPF